MENKFEEEQFEEEIESLEEIINEIVEVSEENDNSMENLKPLTEEIKVHELLKGGTCVVKSFIASELFWEPLSVKLLHGILNLPWSISW